MKSYIKPELSILLVSTENLLSASALESVSEGGTTTVGFGGENTGNDPFTTKGNEWDDIW